MITFKGYFTESDVIFPKYIDTTKSKLFIIANFTLESEEKIKIKGNFSGLPTGFIEIECTEEVHPQYGSSYNVISYKHYIPQEHEGVSLYLKKFFNLTDRQASKIYDIFGGDNVLQRLFPEIDKVMTLKGLFNKQEKYEQFQKRCQTHMEGSEVRYFLYEFGVNEKQVKETISKFGVGALDKVKENPYNLLKVHGIGFRTADKVFLQLGNDKRDERRILASLYTVIQESCDKKKSLYIFEKELLSEINIYLGLNTYDVFLSPQELAYQLNRRNLGSATYDEKLDATIYKDLKVLSFGSGTDRVVFIYKYYEWETETAHRVISALKSTEIMKYDVSEEELENGDKPLNEQQKEAIRNCFNHKISIIRGYGGTGKSTIIKKIIDKCNKENLTYTLLAPTGKAVDVLIGITQDSTKCATIHRKLGLKDEGDLPEELLTEDIVIIDESSMMALPLFYSLLSGLPNLSGERNKKIVLVGDDNQLPPIGLGKPFLDLINLGLVPEVRLFQIYRQKEDSLILENSKKVIEYSNNPVEENLLNLIDTSDWKTYNTYGKSDLDVKELILSIVQYNGWRNEEDVILTAQYKGEAGITELNLAMQRYLHNETKYFYKGGFHLFYLGDRVMHINENWYRDSDDADEKEVYPMNMLTDRRNLEKLYEITDKYSQVKEKKDSIFGYSLMDKIGKDIVYNGRTGNLEVSRVVVGKYRDGEISVVKNTHSKEITGTADKNVYNGNWGKVIAVKTENGWYGLNMEKEKIELLPFEKLFVPGTKEKEEYVLIVDFGDKIVAYTQDRLERLTLFYAASVHKSQGSQFKRVYALCLPSSSFLIDKYWLYTELSRAQEELYYFSTPAFTKTVQLKCNLEKKRGIFVDYFNYHFNLKK